MTKPFVVGGSEIRKWIVLWFVWRTIFFFFFFRGSPIVLSEKLPITLLGFNRAGKSTAVVPRGNCVINCTTCLYQCFKGCFKQGRWWSQTHFFPRLFEVLIIWRKLNMCTCAEHSPWSLHDARYILHDHARRFCQIRTSRTKLQLSGWKTACSPAMCNLVFRFHQLLSHHFIN